MLQRLRIGLVVSLSHAHKQCATCVIGVKSWTCHLCVVAGAYDASELVCGSCSALASGKDCPEHGSAYVEWKCK